MKDLREAKALFQIIVDWDRYRPKKRQVIQGANCLDYGHDTKNCLMRPMQEHEGNNRVCPKRA